MKLIAGRAVEECIERIYGQNLKDVIGKALLKNYDDGKCALGGIAAICSHLPPFKYHALSSTLIDSVNCNA